MLLSELTHRVKNTLAIVQSIAHQTMNASKSREEFVKSLDGRLAALANAHTLLVESEWQGAELGALARNQFAAYMSGDLDRLRIKGDPILLPADLATPFGLVLHELATNATKYGALSNDEGTVDLSWHLKSGNPPILTVIWRERGGPPVKDPGPPGFGTVLIARGIPDARIGHQFHPDGIVCRIELPLKARGKSEVARWRRQA